MINLSDKQLSPMKNNNMNTNTNTNTNTTSTMDPAVITKPPGTKRPDAITTRRLAEYGKRHYFTPDAVKVVSYLYMNGPTGCNTIIRETGLRHDQFFSTLCIANRVLIMDKRAITVDVCLTSRKAIAAIPESSLEKPEAPVATVVEAEAPALS